MTVRRETVESRRETGAWSREDPRRTWISTSRVWAASPPACALRSLRAGLSQQRIRGCSRSGHE